jgi:hypothetical protein
MSNINETMDDYANYEYFRREIDQEINKIRTKYSEAYCVAFRAIPHSSHKVRENALTMILEERDKQIASLNLKKDWLKGLIQHKYKNSDNEAIRAFWEINNDTNT